jgi:hypothetical protein
MTFQVKGQEFEVTGKYVLIEPKYELDSLFWVTPYEERKPIKVFLTAKSDRTNHLQTFLIHELETYEGYEIYSLTNPKLDNIKEIVLVKFEYVACCSSFDSHYFLITKNDNWIKLPLVGHVSCDGPEPFEEYRFPIQKFGLSKSIVKTTSYQNQEYQVDSVAVKETFTWSGKELIINKN